MPKGLSPLYKVWAIIYSPIKQWKMKYEKLFLQYASCMFCVVHLGRSSGCKLDLTGFFVSLFTSINPQTDNKSKIGLYFGRILDVPILTVLTVIKKSIFQ